VAGRTLAIQQAVDAAIVAQGIGLTPLDSSADLRLKVDSLPQKLGGSFLLLIDEPNLEPWLGPTFFALGLATQCLMAANLLVGEKESGVLNTIRRMGLIEVAHWGSWFLVFCGANLLSAGLVGLVAPFATNMNLFTKTDPSVIVLVWWLACCGHSAMACFLAAVCPAKLMEHCSALTSLLVVGFTFVLSSMDT
jgi:hypothetical protein